MKIVVGSGKGGTGKTTVSLGLSLSLAENKMPVQYIDCDVEEPNAHLFFKEAEFQKRDVEVLVPEIDKAQCNFCEECAKFCAYNALAIFPNTALVFNEMCHSCGGCKIVCPQGAISEVKRKIGEIHTAIANNKVQISYGKLNVGETQSPPLIRAVKKEIADKNIAIIDAPPGTACPFVETIRHGDFCLLVTEPTPFGLHDLKTAVEVVSLIGVPFGVLINRSDIGDSSVEEFCSNEKIPVLMKIPNDRNIAVAYSNGMPITEADPKYKLEFMELHRKIYERVGNHKR
ncbi:MAG TPA: ATP-binding protein [bacterium]|nr:P-loop NTPase [Myxococcales bacterium]HPW45974.1 ATP-binding protein [bacterium]HQC50264.1 ATP-binding protein [bacterium]HQH81059.1 ATP-binding protein [bacterium]